jgi:hypothetical protein
MQPASRTSARRGGPMSHAPELIGLPGFRDELATFFSRRRKPNESFKPTPSARLNSSVRPPEAMHPAYFEDRWAELRRRKRLERASWLVAAILGLGGGYLSSLFAAPWIFYCLAALGAVVFIGGFNYSLSFRCPGCDNFFFQSTFWRNPWTRKCVHCGRQVGSQA